MTITPQTLKSFGKWIRRGIDLFVISFLAVMGISIGSQLVEWWNVDPLTAQPDFREIAGADLDWNSTSISMEFGDATTSIERTPVRGKPEDLDESLTRIAHEIVASSQPPATPALDSERSWLKALKTAPPVMSSSTHGNVYRRSDPLPSFVATRFVAPEASNSLDPDDSENGELSQRVVGWGLAFPSGPGEWTIYAFRPESTRVATASVVRTVPIPDAARRLTDMTGKDGNRWLIFQGRGEVEGWVQHFDSVFDKLSIGPRRVDARSAGIKYRTPDTDADLQINRNRDGSLTGVLWLSRNAVHH